MYTLLHISCKNKQVESKSKKFLITEKKQPLNFNTFCKLQTPANGIHSQSLSISYQSQVSFKLFIKTCKRALCRLSPTIYSIRICKYT